MSIDINNLIIMYQDIGDHNDSGLNSKEKGLLYLTPLTTLLGLKFIDLTPYLLNAIEQQIDDNPPLECIKEHTNRGVEKIYNFNTYNNEEIVIAKWGDQFTIRAGNHRVLALILLGETHIQVGKGKCIMLDEDFGHRLSTYD